MRLTPNMVVKPKKNKLEYVEQGDLVGKELIIHQPNFEPYNTTEMNYDIDKLPLINDNDTIVTVLDQKRLFDLGIDTRDLKNYNLSLKNIIYSPLDHPWGFTAMLTGALIAISAIIVLFLCCFKGNISCNKKYNRDFKISDSVKDSIKKK